MYSVWHGNVLQISMEIITIIIIILVLFLYAVATWQFPRCGKTIKGFLLCYTPRSVSTLESVCDN